MDAALSQLDTPNNLPAQQLLGTAARVGVIESVEEEEQLSAALDAGDLGILQQSRTVSSSKNRSNSSSSKKSAASSSIQPPLPAVPVSSVSGDGFSVRDDPQLSYLRKFLEHAALVSCMFVWGKGAGRPYTQTTHSRTESTVVKNYIFFFHAGA